MLGEGVASRGRLKEPVDTAVTVSREQRGTLVSRRCSHFKDTPTPHRTHATPPLGAFVAKLSC